MSVVYEIRSASWWKAASWRALRTAVAVLIPLLAATTIFELDLVLAASTVGLSVVASYLTSLAGLKEVVGDTVPKWVAIGVRAIKQFAQTAVGFIGASLLVTEVDWLTLLSLSASAAVMTILQGVATALPEADTRQGLEIEPELEATESDYDPRLAANDDTDFTDRTA